MIKDTINQPQEPLVRCNAPRVMVVVYNTRMSFYERLVYARYNKLFGQLAYFLLKMLGAERIMVKCQDGKERLCRIRGKLKRRVWIREGDIVLVSPWDFQQETRGDIFWRYRKNQSDWLRSHNYLTM